MTLLGIITSSVIAPDDNNRYTKLVEWHENLKFMAETAVRESVSVNHTIQPQPEGFAKGMNEALCGLIKQLGDWPEWILCINDDLHPDQECLVQLWKHRSEELVTCPTTDITSCSEQYATGPKFESPRRAAFVPAICWLIPAHMAQYAMGFLMAPVVTRKWLFDESLGRAWFEDNIAARIWQKRFGPQPFLVAPMAWAHHEGSRTSNLIPQEERTNAARLYEQRVNELGI